MISDGQPVNAASSNAAFASKTADTTITGVYTLSNAGSDSIPDLQAAVNSSAGFVSSGTLTIAANGQIGISDQSSNQYIRVVGDGGPVTADSTPFGTGGTADGALITIAGTDDTNTVKITANDSADGAGTNGDAELLRGYTITFRYDAVLERYLEVSRNF